jgi:magnesium transporter
MADGTPRSSGAAKRVNRITRKLGLDPGTLVHVGLQKDHNVRVTVIDYDANGHYKSWEPKELDECVPLKASNTVSWINIDGIHEVKVVERIGHLFGIHGLILEDILHAGQRPKIEDMGDHSYIVIKMLEATETEREVDWEQLSMIVGPNFLITFQEKEGDIFDPIREKIKQDKGKIRKEGPDYLAYSLMDLVVDHYFVVLERIGDKIAELEDDVIGNPAPNILNKINKLKRATLTMRRSVWPVREVISTMQRTESDLIKETTKPFLKDVYDHTIQIVDTVETFRDMLSGMVEIYMSTLSNRMNEVMKVLTMIATVFIPLTFLVGVYGMNFDHMPELRWKLGYPLVWLIMLVSAYVMVAYFRRKKWF